MKDTQKSTLDVQPFASMFCSPSETKWVVSEVRGDMTPRRMYLGCTMQEAIGLYREEFPELNKREGDGKD
jgi:hypothetical protein